MLRSLVIAVLLAVFAVPVPAGAVLAQNHPTSDQLLKLKGKVEAKREAYHRFEMAEKDAQAAGSPDRAEVYRQAKEQARREYAELSAQLQKAQADRADYEKRVDALRAPER